MAFLTLNGWEVGISEGRMAPQEFGAAGNRAFGGTQRDTRRRVVQHGEFTTTVLSGEDAEALQHLLAGEGWHFPYDGRLSSEDTGLNPEPGYTATIGTATPNPHFGAARLYVPSGTTLYYDIGLSGAYTVMAWISTGGAYTHRAKVVDDFDSSTTYYAGGTATGTAVQSFTTSTTAVVLNGIAPGGGASAVYYDDVVILPWAATAGQMAAWGAASVAFSALPKLDLAGDCVRRASAMEVRAKITDGRYLQGKLSSSWSDTLRRVSFSLDEV